jgi:hypothetical protein
MKGLTMSTLTTFLGTVITLLIVMFLASVLPQHSSEGLNFIFRCLSISVDTECRHFMM